MKTKTIVFTQPGTVQLLEQELAAPGVEQVQVRLAVSTVSSGTERAVLLDDPNLSIYGKKETFPQVMGYSCAGVVTAAAVGADRPGAFSCGSACGLYLPCQGKGVSAGPVRLDANRVNCSLSSSLVDAPKPSPRGEGGPRPARWMRWCAKHINSYFTPLSRLHLISQLR